MPLAARRTFRLASVVALSLALGYGLAMPLPFFAPFFGALLTTAPAPPMGLKGHAEPVPRRHHHAGRGIDADTLAGQVPGVCAADHCHRPLPRHDHQHRASPGSRRYAGGGRLRVCPRRGPGGLCACRHRDEGAAARHRVCDRQPADRLSLLSGGPAGSRACGASASRCSRNPVDCPAIHADRAGARDDGVCQSCDVPVRHHEIGDAVPAGIRPQRADCGARDGRRHVSRRPVRDPVLVRVEALAKPVDVLPADAAAQPLHRGQDLRSPGQPPSTGLLAGRDFQLPVHVLSGRRRQRERQGPVPCVRGPIQPLRHRHLVRMGRDRRAGMAARAPSGRPPLSLPQGAR